MKKIQHLYIFTIAFLLVAFNACQDERFGTDNPETPSDTPYAPRTIGDYTFTDDEMRFAISIENLNGPKTRAAIGGATETDAVSGATVGLGPGSTGNVENISGYTAFEAGDEIGLFVVERTDPTVRAFPARRENYAQNVKWKYHADANPKKSGFIPAGTGDEQQKNRILYPGKNIKVDIYAYYPYTENEEMIFDDADRYVFTVEANQRWNAVKPEDRNDLEKSTFMKSDLLWADSGQDGQLKGPVTLNFTHAMSLVELTITADNPYLTSINQISEVQLLNVMPELHYGGNQKPETKGTPQNIPMRLVSQKEHIPYTTDKYITRIYRALIPAQTFNDGDELFHISMGSSTYTYRIAKRFDLEAGKKNKYSLILNDRDPNELFYNRKDEHANGFNLKLNKNISGQSTDLLIAAPWIDNGKGACYTYSYAGINWNKTGDLRTLITSDCLSFGSSMDVGKESILIGAPINNNKTGNIYLFQCKNNVWSLIKEESGKSQNEEFGTSVAVAEVGNTTKFFVSAPGSWNQKDWLRQTSLTDLNVWNAPLEAATTIESTKDILAFEKKLVTQHSGEVIIHDVGFDQLTSTPTGITDPIVTLSNDFLFCRSGDAIKVIDPTDPTVTTYYLQNPENNTNDLFGLSASITGNSRLGYAVIGAPGANNEKGAVYIWKCDKFKWDRVGKIQPTSLKEGTRFGTSVAIIETTDINKIKEISIAVSGMNNVYVFNNINNFIITTP